MPWWPLLQSCSEGRACLPALPPTRLQEASLPAMAPFLPQAMCSSDVAGQSFLKQAMQRAMPRADYGGWPARCPVLLAGLPAR